MAWEEAAEALLIPRPVVLGNEMRMDRSSENVMPRTEI